MKYHDTDVILSAKVSRLRKDRKLIENEYEDVYRLIRNMIFAPEDWKPEVSGCWADVHKTADRAYSDLQATTEKSEVTEILREVPKELRYGAVLTYVSVYLLVYLDLAFSFPKVVEVAFSGKRQVEVESERVIDVIEIVHSLGVVTIPSDKTRNILKWLVEALEENEELKALGNHIHDNIIEPTEELLGAPGRDVLRLEKADIKELAARFRESMKEQSK